jgi:hypothetical protein
MLTQATTIVITFLLKALPIIDDYARAVALISDLLGVLVKALAYGPL